MEGNLARRARPSAAAVATVVLALACIQTSAPAIESLDLPLEHWAYEMLERFEVRAGLDHTGLDTRPLRRGQVARLVRRLLDGAAAQAWTPTRIERGQLRMLEQEFSAELVAQGGSGSILARAYHHWQGERWEAQLFFAARPEARHGPTAAGGEFAPTDMRLFFEPTVALALDDFAAAVPVFLTFRTSDGVLRNSTDPRAGEAEFVFDTRDRFSVTRRVEPYARFRRGALLVDTGRERLQWGPGRHNGMLLRDHTPPLDLLRLDLDFGWIRYLHLGGQMRPAMLQDDDPPLVEKYVGAHRLALQAHRRLVLAVSEVVVYGDRGLDLAYLNPVNVFYVTQANNGDLDNVLGSIDGKLVLPSLELYGELVVDDLNLRRGLAHFGNKLGVLAGFLWTGPFGDWDVDGEWSWASQYTYTHQIAINRYEHFGRTLGSRAGTDADLWVAGITRRLSRGWSLRGFYELERHGQGDLTRDQEERDTDEQEYLSGTVESRHQPGLQIRYRGLRNLELDAAWRWLRVVHPSNDPAAASRDDWAAMFAARLEF